MRLIDGDSARDNILDAMLFAVENLKVGRKSSELRIFLTGYAAGLKNSLRLIEQEKTFATIIGENNLYRLGIKEREHRVQPRY